MARIHRNRRLYIYRSIRRNGRVTSEYGGSGIDAFLISQMETIERDEAGVKGRSISGWRSQNRSVSVSGIAFPGSW